MTARSLHKKQIVVLGIAMTLLVLGATQLRSSTGKDISSGNFPSPVVANTEPIVIAAPAVVSAGDDFTVSISGLEPHQPAQLTLDSGYGLRLLDVPTDASTASVSVKPWTGPASGLVLATVVQGAKVATATFELEPGPPVGPIDVYLGPRTVIADNEHFVMLVAVPEDSLGNPVANNTAVDFATTRADLSLERAASTTDNLVAWYEVFSGTVAGRSRVATASGDAGAPERTFLEVADLPEPFEIVVLESLLPADGQALLTVKTTQLADRFGNVVPDGTAVTLDAQGASGTRRIYGQSVDGYGEFTLEVPDRPGSVKLLATASGVQSKPLTISIESAVASLTAEVQLGDEANQVNVGPVLSVRNSFVPEGTIARVIAADGTVATVDLSLGVGTATFTPDTDMSVVTVEVLGSSIEVGSES